MRSWRHRRCGSLLVAWLVFVSMRAAVPQEMESFPVPAGSRPHDVAPAADGGVWYTAQDRASLGWLDPATGETRHIHLGPGARPHGVIVGPDEAPWITDGGLNAIVRVDPLTDEVTHFPLPNDRPNANLNTATFDHYGTLWFTGQNGVYGRLDPATGAMDVYDAPRGRGPYGIATTPSGEVYFASLAGSYVGHIDVLTGEVEVLNPPTRNQGARRVWSDSQNRIWVSEWNAGQVARYDPSNGEWQEWKLPGPNPSAYAVYVDETDKVWLSDFDANAMVRFDPTTEQFASFPLPSDPSNVRQILGRAGEVWVPESAGDQLVVFRFTSQQGDLNQDGVLDASDIDLLSVQIQTGAADLQFDLNDDGLVDPADRQVWIEQLRRTYPGDANLDGEFNTADLVAVLSAGQYEDGAPANSGWSTGDWDGDGEFSSADLVAALAAGGYEQGPRAVVRSVPEPSSLALLGAALTVVSVCRRRGQAPVFSPCAT